ncbi:DUF1345 domain-containing protein [Dyella jiangningensis]|jgi:uncharacterized membrane protein|uniref:DUF1345 domain-containing protein n=1 Tax=Dyella jiangningensis TaxID=1379159 RepID=UPI0024101B0E|nr:DUF1345 domain-containing protein [Dyella jiangningensis]MDG2537439.1 DUF1345 domain-containing protein [Dyella jiangningensis]
MNTPTGNAATPGRRVHFRMLRARPRLAASTAFFLATWLVLWFAFHMKPAKALLLGFDLGVLVYLIALARLFGRCSTMEMMRGQARRQDTGRWGVLWTALGLIGVVAVALTTELGAAHGGGVQGLVIAASSIVLSWLFLNIMFAMHYAHGYYGDFGKKHEGLEFPGTPQPDYWDFAYFAIVIGMTFQVSDVQITSRYLRRVALMHSVIAFFFNVFIIAISVNIAASLVA